MATEVVATARGSAVSRQVLEALRARAAEHELSSMIAPARPVLKHRYPLIDIESYARWTRADGLPFDPCIRTHVELGARILTTTPEAMRITAAIAEWEQMTSMTFPETGDYVVPEALTTVHIDRAANRGIYIEPAIWIEHP